MIGELRNSGSNKTRHNYDKYRQHSPVFVYVSGRHRHNIRVLQQHAAFS